MVDVRSRLAPASTGRHRWISSSPTKGERGHRPDLQGLRAVAVSLVVVYHLFPARLPGGYVGVDVFFVISGFLITSHLARGLRTRGRVFLLDFYGRRARRLMPAAVLVLSVTWLVSQQVLPTTRLPDAAEQVRASALYFQNWVLARDAVTYLKSDDAPSPVQHFWSLSVEEQFYLVWPVLFLAAVLIGYLIARRRRAVASGPIAVHAMFGLALVVTAGSLWYSAHETAANPAAAYFVTTTRMWELGIGGALALAPEALVNRLSRLGPLAWAGLVLVLVSAFVIDSKSAFPGTIALLPVGGATMLIASGGLTARMGPGRLMSLAPMVFIGDISYSLYLWHWPIIVLWKAHTGSGVGLTTGLALAAVSVVLAWLTKVFVEDPFRTSRFITHSAVRSLATVVVALVPVAMATTWLHGQPPTLPKLAPVAIAVDDDASAGAGGTADGRGKTHIAVHIDRAYPGAAVLAAEARQPPKAPLRPSLAQAASDYGAYGKGPGGCQTRMTSAAESVCRFGDTAHPVKTVYIVGDSVAAEFFDDLNALAKQRHWLLVTDLHSRCPWSATMAVSPTGSGNYTSCHVWGRRALARVLAAKPAMVITSGRPSMGTPGHVAADATSFRAIGAGMATYWNRLLAEGIAVTAIRETPEMGRDIPDCLSRPDARPGDCAVSAAKAVVRKSPLQVAKKLVPAAVLIDLNRYFCTATTCPAVVGNIVVYIDSHHVTTTYAATVAPYLYEQLLALPELR